MTQPNSIENTVAPGTGARFNLPQLQLYSIRCSPVCKAVEADPPLFDLIVAAPNSTTATRKALKFFQDNMPEAGVTAIEVYSFILQADRSNYLVVV